MTAICITNCFAQLPPWLPTNGLIAWYPFNGNANDESGNTNNGTVFGATLITDRFGNLSSAYRFDGTTYIKGSSTNFPTQDRTVSIWYKIDDWSNHNTLMGYGGGVCGTSFFAVLNPSGIQEFHTASHCNVNDAFTPNGYSENSNWNNWIITSDGTKTTYYLNGIKTYDTSVIYYGTDVIGKDFAFGSMSAHWGIAPYADQNVSYLKGSLDDIAIYNRVLSSNEIQQLYCSCTKPSAIIADKSTLEGNTGTKQLKFPVTLSNAYTSTVTIKYKTVNNTATAGSDYVLKQGKLTFNPGEIKKNISITINGDIQAEPNETFYVVLFSVVNVTIADDTAVGIIKNDDGALANAKKDEVESSSVKTDVTVYPNPVKDFLFIQTKNKATFTLTDATGKVILIKQIQSNGNINVSMLQAGLYFLRNGTTGEVQKIIIEN